MNAKILNLLQQSVSEYKTEWGFTENEQVTIPQQITNRFAELIIRQCLTICDGVEDDYLEEVKLREYCGNPSIQVAIGGA
jgi:hypothetical protein